MANVHQYKVPVEFKDKVEISDNLTVKGGLSTGVKAGVKALGPRSAKKGYIDDFHLTGLHPQWNCNFGGPLAGQAQAVSLLNLLTPATTMHRLAMSLLPIAESGEVVSVAQAGQIFGGTGIVGVTVAIGTTGSPGATPTVTQRVTKLSGGVSGTVVMSVGADLASAGDETLILFTGDTVFDSTGVLKLTLHANNELLAASSEVYVSGDDTDIYTKQTAPSDLDQILILTDTGDCTIKAGSFIYLHAGAATDSMALKACLRTTGGTIAVTYGN